MVEIELKSVIADLDALRRHLEQRGTTVVFEGELEDRRYDTASRALRERDHVLRVRIYRGTGDGRRRAYLDWKGPMSIANGYKRRDELTTEIADPETLGAMLERLGYEVTMTIDRHIWQYEIAGAIVRLERYPRMDDLVEVEGTAESIERAIERIGLPRAGFTTERLPDFVSRYEARTAERAALSTAELAGAAPQDPADA